VAASVPRDFSHRHSRVNSRLPSQLSGGQRQRMALARALAVEPKVLLLDEPFGALDANVRAELRTWLRRLHDDVGVTTVLVTHDQEEAMDVADRIAVMNHGAIEQVGAPRELYEQPANDFVMGFLGPVARLDDELVRPHDLVLSAEPEPGAREAMVSRVVHLGFEVRVELTPADGPPLTAQLSREEADALDLRPNDIVYVRALSGRGAADDHDVGVAVVEPADARQQPPALEAGALEQP
jgi:sulfate/thiosulfate transport system ATP-binding protein